MAHVFSVMIKYSFPVVAMLIPSLDDLARQLHVVGSALVGQRAREHIVDLRERVALRTPCFDGPVGSQVIIDYLDVQVLGRMAPRTRLHGRHSSSPPQFANTVENVPERTLVFMCAAAIVVVNRTIDASVSGVEISTV